MPGQSNGEREHRSPALRLILGAAIAAVLAVSTIGAAGRGGAVGALGRILHPRHSFPIVHGRPESCLACHGNVRGIEAAHSPKTIGCAACHGGDPTSSTAAGAHRGLVRVPGNLGNALQTCGQAGCHESIIPRVGHSVMSTMAGIIAVDRLAFGDPGGTNPHVLDLGQSAADSHLRQLCASCHLGQAKDAWGPQTESSRGGGCNACHLGYTANARRELRAYASAPAIGRRAVPSEHPTLTVNVDGAHCFGCHSRSARISTNFEGWHELSPDQASAPAAAVTRRLEDGRTFVRITPDVHHERGLDCIDCHPANEVMGRGVPVQSKADQVVVTCEDCHSGRSLRGAAAPDPESQLLLGLRQWALPEGGRIVTTRTGDALIGVSIDSGGRVTQRLKSNGHVVTVPPPATACRRKAHQRLTCAACHTAWAPRCISCHTDFDPAAEAYDHLDRTTVRGAWRETAGPFEATPPTLGVREDARAQAGDGRVIDTFIPGMILELDRNRDPAWPPDRVTRRWYARIAAHTTRREVRACVSCHGDPVALGFGRGVLRFNTTGRTGAWTFNPRQEALADGLPADAWVGFLQTRRSGATSRDDARPFTAEEQARILRVGACLTCHAGTSAVMTDALDDFEAVLRRRTPACIEWAPR